MAGGRAARSGSIPRATTARWSATRRCCLRPWRRPGLRATASPAPARRRAAGADCVLMDDGFQNPYVAPDLAFVVVDGGYGFGNRRLLPAGPLRERLADGLARASAVIRIGRDRHAIDRLLPAGLPRIEAELRPAPDAPQDRRPPAAGVRRDRTAREAVCDLERGRRRAGRPRAVCRSSSVSPRRDRAPPQPGGACGCALHHHDQGCRAPAAGSARECRSPARRPLLAGSRRPWIACWSGLSRAQPERP